MAKRFVSIVGLVVVALVVVACGGSSSDNSSGGSAAKPASNSSDATASVALRKTDLGRILVDGKGQTLYLFEKDKGTSSACDGACAGAWPPLTTTGTPSAGTGVIASKLGTTKRADGSTEVTYNGHPLYTYAGDGAPGQTSGQGLDDYGAEWYVLSRSGKTVEDDG
jgi:predicted lipoprotein with Yx(FWY)xxD motif